MDLSDAPATPPSTPSTSAAALARSPALKALPEALLEELAARGRTTWVRAGDLVFEAGDLPDAIHVVLAGRLHVVADDAAERLLRILVPGAVVGELGVLTGQPRSAVVRAARDSELLTIGAAEVQALLRDVPGFASGIARSIARQIAGEGTPDREVPVARQVITVVGLDPGAPVADVEELVAGELRRAGRLAVVRDALPPGAERVRALDAILADADRVLLPLALGRDDRAWATYGLRQADVVVAIATRGPEHLDQRTRERLRGCELLACGPAAAGSALAALVAELDPRRVTAIPAGPRGPDRVRALGRRLAGTSIGLVLSGGGAKGLSHLGVLDELEAAGVVIDRLGGASQGAVIAALVAKGLTAAEATAACVEVYLGRSPTGDWTLPTVALTRGLRTDTALQAHLGGRRIEELPVDLFTVSCDLFSGELVVHRQGELWEAVRASLSIPGVFPPVRHGDRVLVDGGVRNNLPVDVMAADHEGPIIAVDVTTTPGRRREGPPRVPRLPELLLRTLGVASLDRDGSNRRMADLLITPDVASVQMLDWQKLDEVREAGRAAAREALREAPSWLRTR